MEQNNVLRVWLGLLDGLFVGLFVEFGLLVECVSMVDVKY